MRLLPNEFAMESPATNRIRGEIPPAIGAPLLLGMMPILLVYWLLLAVFMVVGGLVGAGRADTAKG